MISRHRGLRGVFFTICLAVLSACSPPDYDDYAQIKAVSARSLTTLLAEQKFEEWSAFYQPGAQLNGSDLAATVMKSYARGLHYAFPDMTITLIEQIGADNKVVTHFVIKGTHEGAFSALPPTNRSVELEGVAIDHFKGGLILRTRLMLDVSRLNNSLEGRASAGR